MKGDPKFWVVNPFKTGRVNVVRFVWPEIFSKLLQKGMSVPNFKEVGTKLRSAERTGLHKVLKKHLIHNLCDQYRCSFRGFGSRSYLGCYLTS